MDEADRTGAAPTPLSSAFMLTYIYLQAHTRAPPRFRLIFPCASGNFGLLPSCVGAAVRSDLNLKQAAKKWTVIGWQGLTLPVQADWHLGCVQGTRDKGYVRIDDDERVRAEIRWEKPAKKPEAFSLLADRLLRQMEKFGRKKEAFTIKRDVRVAAPPGREFECFETKGKVTSYGCLMRCESCGRIILGRVIGTSHDDLKALAAKLFNGMGDHPEADGLDHWDVYDLRFALPPDFELQQTKMRTGALEMLFSSKKKTLDVRRIGLAGIVLKDRTLRNFFINYCYSELKAFAYEAEEIPVRDHPGGVGLTGRQTWRARLLSHNIGKRYVHAYSWLCDDRIYIFRMVSPLAEDPQFFELAEMVLCHQGEMMNDEC